MEDIFVPQNQSTWNMKQQDSLSSYVPCKHTKSTAAQSSNYLLTKQMSKKLIRHSESRVTTHCSLATEAPVPSLHILLNLTQTELNQRQGRASTHGTFWGQVFWLSLSALVRSLHWSLVPVHRPRAPISVFLCDQKQSKIFFF